MSLLEVPIGKSAPEIVNTIIEIPRGSTNKYEVDQESGMLRLDRVLYSPLFYPFDYGFIPQTHYLDGDPLDVLVLKMQDEKGPDEKILCVATKDPRYSNRDSISRVNPHTLKEVMHFFEVYKTLEQKDVDVVGWEGEALALELIRKYRTDRG